MSAGCDCTGASFARAYAAGISKQPGRRRRDRRFSGEPDRGERARRETPVHQALAGSAEGRVSRERRHPHPGRARLVALPRRNYVGDRDTGRSLRWKLHFQCDLQ